MDLAVWNVTYMLVRMWGLQAWRFSRMKIPFSKGQYFKMSFPTTPIREISVNLICAVYFWLLYSESFEWQPIRMLIKLNVLHVTCSSFTINKVNKPGLFTSPLIVITSTSLKLAAKHTAKVTSMDFMSAVSTSLLNHSFLQVKNFSHMSSKCFSTSSINQFKDNNIHHSIQLLKTKTIRNTGLRGEEFFQQNWRSHDLSKFSRIHNQPTAVNNVLTVNSHWICITWGEGCTKHMHDASLLLLFDKYSMFESHLCLKEAQKSEQMWPSLLFCSCTSIWIFISHPVVQWMLQATAFLMSVF